MPRADTVTVPAEPQAPAVATPPKLDPALQALAASACRSSKARAAASSKGAGRRRTGDLDGLSAGTGATPGLSAGTGATPGLSAGTGATPGLSAGTGCETGRDGLSEGTGPTNELSVGTAVLRRDSRRTCPRHVQSDSLDRVIRRHCSRLRSRASGRNQPGPADDNGPRDPGCEPQRPATRPCGGPRERDAGVLEREEQRLGGRITLPSIVRGGAVNHAAQRPGKIGAGVRIGAPGGSVTSLGDWAGKRPISSVYIRTPTAKMSTRWSVLPPR